jgi:hypothetical protein
LDPPGTNVRSASSESPDEEEESSAQTEHDSNSSASDDELRSIHERAYIRCLIILVAFLHTKHHTSFRACALILMALNFILTTLPGNLLGGDRMPGTLTTVFSRLQLRDRFKVHPICYLCHRIFSGEESSDLCPDCEEEVYRPRTRQLFKQLFGTELIGDGDEDDNLGYHPKRTPHVVQPIQLLSTGLRDFFTRPGMVHAINAWKTRVIVPGELKSIQDGNVWKTIEGPDGNAFFSDDEDDDEIRLGVTLSLDW